MKSIIQVFIEYLNFPITCSVLEKKVQVSLRNTSMYIVYCLFCNPISSLGRKEGEVS